MLARINNKGEVVQEYSMIVNYWFPAIPVFPDNAAPVISSDFPSSIVLTEEKPVYKLALGNMVTDEDNMDAAIVKTVKSVSDATVLTAEMNGGDLVITPLKAGSADITVQVNSNGKLAETVVSVTVNEATGIDGVDTEDAEVVGRYTLDGKMLDAPQRGINIIRMSDGSIRKVIVR